MVGGVELFESEPDYFDNFVQNVACNEGQRK